MLDWLFKRPKAAPRKRDWVEKLVWLPPGHPQNPFAQEVLDCRAVALTFISTTKDPAVAKSFGSLRKSDGRELIGKLPDSALTCECDLHFPAEGKKCDGPLFLAHQMEDKWDFFHYDSRLYLRRSWTGTLLHVAECRFQDATVTIPRIYSELNNAWGEKSFAVAEMQFLITTHLLGKPAPFPMPPEFPRAGTEAIAMLGFGKYGRRAQFAVPLEAGGSKARQPG